MEMKWSKLKKQLEQNFCDALKDRIGLFVTNYRADHEPETRFWITLDGKEIYSVSKLKWVSEYFGLADEIREVNKSTNYKDPNQKANYYAAYDEAEDILHKKGLISADYFYDSLKAYLSVPFDEALNSQDIIIKALAMIDKRLGKRRLKEMVLLKDEHSLVNKLFAIRCEAEGLEGVDHPSQLN